MRDRCEVSISRYNDLVNETKRSGARERKKLKQYEQWIWLKAAQKSQATIKFKAAVISGLIELNKRWEDRISTVESKLKRPKEDDFDICSAIRSCKSPMDVGKNSCVKNKQRKTAATNLSVVLYECYTREPRIRMSETSR